MNRNLAYELGGAIMGFLTGVAFTVLAIGVILAVVAK